MKTDQSRDLNLAKRANRNNDRDGRRNLGASSPREHRAAKLPTALRALYDILESNAPTWYRQEHHERAGRGIRKGAKYATDVFIELCELLEAYAPRWYTKEDHERTQSILKTLKKR